MSPLRRPTAYVRQELECVARWLKGLAFRQGRLQVDIDAHAPMRGGGGRPSCEKAARALQSRTREDAGAWPSRHTVKDRASSPPCAARRPTPMGSSTDEEKDYSRRLDSRSARWPTELHVIDGVIGPGRRRRGQDGARRMTRHFHARGWAPPLQRMETALVLAHPPRPRRGRLTSRGQSQPHVSR